MNVQEAVNARYSNRYYDTTKKISQEDLDKILLAGIKAPNGFGVEAWHFFAIDGDKSALKGASMGQQFIEDCSHVIALANYKQEYLNSNPSIITDKLLKNGFDKKEFNKYLRDLKELGTPYDREQIMFAASQMILQATSLGIGSVAVGGFEPEEVANVANIDTNKFEVALLIAFGYSTDTKPKVRYNRSFDEVVTKITL